MRVDARGVAALSTIPGLLKTVAKEGHPCNKISLTALLSDGSVTTKALGTKPGYSSLDYRFVHAGLSQALRQFVEQTSVNAVYGAMVTDIKFLEDGEMVVEYLHERVTKTAKTKLVLACDGKNSKVAAAIMRSNNTTFRGKNGLGVTVYDIPSTGLSVRSISVDPDVITSVAPDLPPEIDHMRALFGKKSSESFSIALFLTPKKYIKHCRGFLGTIVQTDHHSVWRIKTVEEGYNFFQKVLPQIDIRELITKESMEAFISEPPSKFGTVQRRDSLVVHVGETATGGVVFFGDAANCGPPDIGQGVNSAFQDVQVFSNVIDDMCDVSIEQILDTYESRRGADIDALVTVQRFGNPYQYGQAPIRGSIFAMKRKVRRRLAKTFKGILHPVYVDMIFSTLSYSELVRRSDTSARRILLAIIGLFAVPFLAITIIISFQ